MSRRIIFPVLLVMISTGLVFYAVSQGAGQGSDKKEVIHKGEYLVNLAGCNDCHSPKTFTEQGPVPDPSRLLSGHPANEPLPPIDREQIETGGWMLFNSHLTAAAGPWGISFAANLTPDERTGIGLWTEDVFIQALRTGKHMGAGRAILPPMPWFNLANATDQDLKAIFAYLKSLPPVKNAVPAPVPLADIND